MAPLLPPGLYAFCYNNTLLYQQHPLVVRLFNLSCAPHGEDAGVVGAMAALGSGVDAHKEQEFLLQTR